MSDQRNPAPEPAAKIAYHLDELETALDPGDPCHSVPDLRGARGILDIGCGIGQTLLAAAHDPDTLRVGIDIDRESLAYGARHHGELALAAARAERLPFLDAAFDHVFSRVALPYTDVPVALDEIARVLAPAGRLWITLHPAAFTRRQWREALSARRPKDLVFRSYVLLNGFALHLVGRTFPLPGFGRTESFQTKGRTVRMLRARGFESIVADRTPGGSLRLTARRSAAG